MEDYAAKMLLKTDAALREYVTGHVQYREAAVLAALDELRRRGQPAPEEAELRAGLEVGAATQRQLDEAAEAERRRAVVATAPAADETTDESPALYSPITIVLFSIPFTFLAGGVLLGLNLWRLDRKRALLGLACFVVAYFLLGVMALMWALPRYGVSPWYGPMFNLPAILAYVLWFWPRNVGTLSYRSRSWLPPLLLCFVLLFGLQKLTNYQMDKQPKEVREQLDRIMQR